MDVVKNPPLNLITLPVTIQNDSLRKKFGGYLVAIILIYLGGIFFVFEQCPETEFCLASVWVGLVLVAGLFLIWLAFVGRREIKIDKEMIFGTNFRWLGPNTNWQEPVSHYDGVRVRDLSDPESGSRYTVELVHPERRKTFQISWCDHEESARHLQQQAGAALSLPLLSGN
jgi:hypothetical protein